MDYTMYVQQYNLWPHNVLAPVSQNFGKNVAFGSLIITIVGTVV